MILADPEKSAPYIARRRAKLAELANWTDYDAILVTDIRNVRYLSGFSGTAGALLMTHAEGWFITDFRYIAQAGGEIRGLSIHDARDGLDGAASLVAGMGIKSVAFEEEHVTVSTMAKMQAKFGPARLVGVSGLVEKARLYKDEGELEAIAWLVDALGETLDLARSIIRPGALEREIAAELEYALRKKGAEGPAFELIVASGARGALPHGVASAKAVGRGEAVTLDWGARGWGYHSDNTRTFILPGTDWEIIEIYKIVLEANLAAMAMVKPGVPLSQVDSAARAIISKAGYGERFGHGTGHGVGLEVHEAPRVSAVSIEEARPGMVFTIEPGIYLPGKGGVRIEDMVFVTEDGVRPLSDKIPKSLEAMRLP